MTGLSILKQTKSVIPIIENKHWQKNRVLQETAHRQVLLEAAKNIGPNAGSLFEFCERS